MAEAKAKYPFWVDAVHGKHECYGYDEHGVVRAVVNGRDVEIIVPDYLADVRVFVATEENGILFCFGRTEEKFNDRFCGLVMVAKKTGENRYATGVWHELYPWALTHFGFDENQ